MGCTIYLVPLSTTPFTPNSIINSLSLWCHFDIIFPPHDIINSTSLHQTLMFDWGCTDCDGFKSLRNRNSQRGRCSKCVESHRALSLSPDGSKDCSEHKQSKKSELNTWRMESSKEHSESTCWAFKELQGRAVSCSINGKRGQNPCFQRMQEIPIQLLCYSSSD